MAKKKKILIMLTAFVMFLPAAHVIASNYGDSAIKLEGAWIAKVVSIEGQSGIYPYQWSHILSPSASGNSAGIRGSVQVAFPTLPGLDSDIVSPIIGEIVKTGANTAAFNSYWYEMAYGDFGAFINQIVVIGRDWGVSEFVGPGEAETTHHFEYYSPDADNDGDGIPDPGSTPIYTTTITTRDKRIPPPAE